MVIPKNKIAPDNGSIVVTEKRRKKKDVKAITAFKEAQGLEPQTGPTS
jgi:hypothetical protein